MSGCERIEDPGPLPWARILFFALIVPVHMEGLGKALPGGEGLLVPFICDIRVGPPTRWQDDREALMTALDQWLCHRPPETAK